MPGPLPVGFDRPGEGIFSPRSPELLGPVARNTYEAAVLSDSPFFFAPMTEASGPIQDIIGNRYGLASGSPTYGVTGPIAGFTAIDFPLDSAFFTFLHDAGLNVGDGPISIEFFVAPDTNGSYDMAVSKQTNAYAGGIHGVDDAYFMGKAGFAPLGRSSTAVAFTGAWTHVVLTKVLGTGAGRIVAYVNGVAGTVDLDTTAVLVDNALSLLIGRDGATEGINAPVAYVALYRHVLPPERVLAHYQATLTGTTYTQALASALTFAGAMVLQTGKALASSLTFSGTLPKRIDRALASALTFVGSLPKRTDRVLTAALTFSGALAAAKFVAVALSAALTFSGSLTKETGKSLVSALSFSGTLVKSISRSLASALTFSGALTGVRVIQKLLASALTFSGSLTKRTSRSLTAGLTFSGSTVKRTNKGLTAGLTFSGSLVKRAEKALASALSFSGSLVKWTSRPFTAALTFSGTSVKSISRSLTSSLSFVGNLTRTYIPMGTLYFKSLAATLTFSGSLTATLAEALRTIDPFSLPKFVVRRYSQTYRGLRRRG